MTDIVGSTEHAAELGDSAWRELIDQHHATVRRALKRHGGRELDTAGDGFFAVFDAPGEAIACALEIIDAVRELGIEVRVGAHTGEVEQAGRKVGGITVPIAARIMAEAAHGELLVSATVRELTAGSRLVFENRGTRTLKGVPGEWQLYRVTATTPADDAAAGAPPDAGARRAAAVRRSRARPIWRRHPRATVFVVVALVLVVASTGLFAWQPWLKPALAGIPDNSVGLIDSGRNAITAAIEVGQQPGGAIIGDGDLWVTNTGSDTVSQISLETQTVIRIVDVGRSPIGVAATAGSVWVANSGSRTITQISTETARPVNEIEVGNGPTAIASGAGALWVANAGDSTLAKVDPGTATVLMRIPVATRPIALAVDESGVWVASADGAAVTHIDPATGVTLAAPISLGGLPIGIALGGGVVWVATTDGNVTRIDPVDHRVLSSVDVANSAASIAMDGGWVWVADRDGYVLRLSAADPNEAPSRVAVSSSPEALAVADRNVWVATRASPSSHRGGTLHISYIHPPTLDPLGFPDFSAVLLEADGLVGYRHVGGVLGSTLLPALATGLPQPTNGDRTYTFRLRPDLVYSTGEPVRAADFRRAIERAVALELDGVYSGPEFFAVEGVDDCLDKRDQPCDLSRGIVTDEASRTVTFNLVEPDPDLLYKLAMPAAYPVPEGVPMDSPVEGVFPGTGPYVVSSVSEHEVRLVRNPHFTVFDPDVRPDGFADEIVWTADLEPAEQIAMVATGDLDFMPLRGDNRITPEQFRDIQTRFPGQVRQASRSVTAPFFNVELAPFDNVEARQAVNMAIDRAAVVELYGGPLAASITCQFLPPGWYGYEPYCPWTTHPDPGGHWRAPDLDAARGLVEASGTHGAHVVVGPVRARHAALRDYLVSVLRELGYDAVADARIDDESVFAALEAGEIQVGAFEFFTISAGPAEFLVPFTCFGGDGTTNFCDPAFDELYLGARDLQAHDLAAAASAWAVADRALVDAAPVAPVVNEGADFMSERVGNYQFSPAQGVLFDQLWVQ